VKKPGGGNVKSGNHNQEGFGKEGEKSGMHKRLLETANPKSADKRTAKDNVEAKPEARHKGQMNSADG